MSPLHINITELELKAAMSTPEHAPLAEDIISICDWMIKQMKLDPRERDYDHEQIQREELALKCEELRKQVQPLVDSFIFV